MSRRVVAKTGEAIVQNITPDWCLTPIGPLEIPVPYIIIAQFDLSVDVESGVQVHGFDAFTMRSRITRVTGNEAGKGGGTKSGVNCGYCRPVTSTSSVQVHGEFVIRHTDLFEMNCDGPDGPGNCLGKAVYVQIDSFTWLDANACFFGDENAEDMDYGRFDEALEFIYSEMLKNASSDTVESIDSLLARPKHWWEWIGYDPGQRSAAALAMFWAKVRQGGPWDHKPQLDERLGLGSNPGGKDYYFPIRGDGVHEYFYDIWSNIHYGYVGSAAGFSPGDLQSGAGSGLPGAGRNDRADEATVQIGIDLWNRYGKDLTRDQLHKAIVDSMCTLVDAAAEQRGDGGDGVVIPATNKE